jgi:hypothetical protein
VYSLESVTRAVSLAASGCVLSRASRGTELLAGSTVWHCSGTPGVPAMCSTPAFFLRWARGLACMIGSSNPVLGSHRNRCERSVREALSPEGRGARAVPEKQRRAAIILHGFSLWSRSKRESWQGRGRCKTKTRGCEDCAEASMECTGRCPQVASG